ncbi:major facilitator superfamily domain-containing protein [Mycena galopus ATCC 62051]|nr:major facilitator superfamily domain-containing protein [Mycena galopus ATCC 62051]
MASAPGFWTKFKSYIWDSDGYLKSPEERALIRKLDFGILIVSCLGFFLKYLDQNNLANAYISGMKEDLNINGNQYTYMGTCYTIAYAIMQVPSTMIIQKIRPSYYLAFCEIGWGIWTFAQAGAKNSQQMYLFRFMVGLFESAFFPCLLYLMGSWYTKTELAKRLAIFHLTGSVGTAMLGYLQAAIYNNLNGHAGLAGWRWLYIICGCMTVPCGLLLFFVLPDLPSNSKAWYLSDEEKAFALDRAIRNGKGQPTASSIPKGLVADAWADWYWFVLGYILYGESCAATAYFGIWLKAENFSVDARNVIPSCGALISVFCIFMWGFLSDLTGSRFTWVFVPLAYGLIPNGILAVWPPSVKLKEFAFLTGGVQLMTAVFYTWANEVCKSDNEERALVVSSMNGLQYAVAAWLPIVIFPQVEAPTFRRGFPGTFGLVIAALVVIVIIKIFADRDERRERAALGVLSGDGLSTDEKNDEDAKEKDPELYYEEQGLASSCQNPLVGGHEGVGEIVAIGNNTSHSPVKVGDRVGVKWLADSCLNASSAARAASKAKLSGFSIDGTFQQYVVSYVNHVTPIPEGFTSQGVTVYRAIKYSQTSPGDWIVLPGAGGGLGHLAIQYARWPVFRSLPLAPIRQWSLQRAVRDINKPSNTFAGRNLDGGGLPGKASLEASIFFTVFKSISILGSYVGNRQMRQRPSRLPPGDK